jgi:EmrB/QacA subfamily drug resistance transporter
MSVTTEVETVADGDVDASRLTRPLRIILAIVIIADVLDLMDSTVTNIAAPTIVRDIGGGESLIKWLGASYALAMGVLLVVGGRLGDRYGKRRMLLVGMIGFIVASVVCGLSVSPTMLIGARLVQGAFGALMIPQGFSILTATFSREQLPKAFTVFAPVMGISAVLGPIVAGLIIGADIGGLTWRPIFLINIVLGSAGLVGALKYLPHDVADEHVVIDGLGAGLLGASMFGLMYGLIEGSTAGWTTMPILSMVAGVLFFAGFCVRQVTEANPLIVPSLLKNRGFTAGMLLGFAYFAAVSGFAYVISLFFQTGLGLSAAHAAYGLSPVMIGMIGASIAFRPLIESLGRRLVVLGLGLTLAGAFGLWLTVTLQGNSVSVWVLVPSLLVIGVGMGACFASIFEVALGNLAPSEGGSASGTLSAVQALATAVGSAVVTTVYFSQRVVHGPAHAMTVSVVVIGGIAALGLGLVWLLPKNAPAEDHAGH